MIRGQVNYGSKPPIDDRLFVIVRFDEPVDPENWHSAIKVLTIFNDRSDNEAARLGSVNDPPQCTYEVHIAHSALKN